MKKGNWMVGCGLKGDAMQHSWRCKRKDDVHKCECGDCEKNISHNNSYMNLNILYSYLAGIQLFPFPNWVGTEMKKSVFHLSARTKWIMKLYKLKWVTAHRQSDIFIKFYVPPDKAHSDIDSDEMMVINEWWYHSNFPRTELLIIFWFGSL